MRRFFPPHLWSVSLGTPLTAVTVTAVAGFVLTTSSASLAQSADAVAQSPAPTSTTYDYSSYEQQTIDQATKQAGATIDPEPEGKRVERIIYRRLPVIEPRDPVPRVFNALHVVTREGVLRRELLVHPGDRYSKVLVDETARNLRKYPQLSVVLIVPLRGSSPNSVVLLVITKDVWSLRLNSDVRYSSAGLEQLLLQPAETNLLGTHHTLSGMLTLDPATFGVGGGYAIPRISKHQLRASFSAIGLFNRASNHFEGSRGTLLLRRPLLNSRSRWAWETNTTWDYEHVRRFIGVTLARYDARITPLEKDDIPYAYHARQLLHRSYITRSFGWSNKRDISVGIEYFRRRFDAPDAPNASPQAVDEFRRMHVPTSDTRLSPFVQLRAYSTSFIRLLNVQTLSLQEDFRTGHDLRIRLYPALSSVGSDRNLLGLQVSAQYTQPVSDGFMRGVVQSTTEMTEDGIQDGLLDLDSYLVTPRVFGARLVNRSRLHYFYRNYLNHSTYLGGDGSLRGYPSSYDVGSSAIVNNTELRTGAASLFSCQIGGAAFYDIGDAFYDIEQLRIKQSAGVGLRVLFPQLDRVVLRADLAFPLAPHGLPSDVAPFSFFVSFRQAFLTPRIGPNALLP